MDKKLALFLFRYFYLLDCSDKKCLPVDLWSTQAGSKLIVRLLHLSYFPCRMSGILHVPLYAILHKPLYRIADRDMVLSNPLYLEERVPSHIQDIELKAYISPPYYLNLHEDNYIVSLLKQ